MVGEYAHPTGVTLFSFALLADAISPASNPAASTQPVPTGIDALLVKLTQNPIPVLIAVMVIMYLFLFRSKGSKDKQRKEMLAQLKRGDEIQTIGGIIGTVLEVRETDVLVKVDETNNTKMRFSRNAIHRVVEPKVKEAK